MQQRPTRARGLSPSQQERLKHVAANNGIGAIKLTFASEIPPLETEWLWDGRIPLGAVTILAGKQGLGKSTFALTLAAEASKGNLSGHALGQPSYTLYLTGEDDPARTLVPRLMAAGADLSKIAFVTLEHQGREDQITVPTHVAQLGERIRELNARFVIFDPLKAFVDENYKMFSEQHVRKVLAPLSLVAQEQRVAMLSILHMRKGGAEGIDPLDLIADSGAFTQAARSVLIYGTHPDTKHQRALCHAKCNLGPLAPSLRLSFEQVALEETISASRVCHEGHTNVTAKQVVGGSDAG